MDHWGEGRSIALSNPSRARAGLYPKLYASFERAALSRGMARASLDSTLEIDVTSVLGTVQAPTLVLHCAEDFMAIEAGRYLAANIPNSRFIELPGADHAPFSGNMSHELVDRIIEFVTGGPPTAATGPTNFGTILFTDIVNSTGHVSELGDAKWRQLLTRHDLAVRDHVDRHGGECVKSTGDGFLITFDRAESAVRCAHSIVSSVAASMGVEMRAALHAGSYEHVGQDIAGIEVHLAARLLDHAQPGEILVSAALRHLVVGSELDFAPRGWLPLRGLTEPCATYVLLTESAYAERPAAWTGGDPDHYRVRDRALLALSRLTPRLARAFTRLVSHPSRT
jgi:class 3 adenylate cyclase